MNVILLYVNKLFKENFDTIFMKNRKKLLKLKKKKNQFLFIFIFFHKNFLKVILL